MTAPLCTCGHPRGEHFARIGDNHAACAEDSCECEGYEADATRAARRSAFTVAADERTWEVGR